jgi:hypothetical protein
VPRHLFVPRYHTLLLSDQLRLNVRLICTERRPNKPKNGGITAGIPRAGRGRDAIGNGVDSSAEVSDSENFTANNILLLGRLFCEHLQVIISASARI